MTTSTPDLTGNVVGQFQTRWRIAVHPAEVFDRLRQRLGCGPLLAQMLLNRGLDDPEEAARFLSPQLQDLHSPLLMADMDRAVERIWMALQRQERILVYGDYDVDGVTSVVILKKILLMLGGRVDFFIPRRFVEGYGLHADRLREFAAAGVRLVISVDSGIRAFEVAELALQLGVDLIVTDHHLPDSELPRAYAILNPHRRGCGYPDKELAGVGVTFKLVQALLERSGKARLIPSFLKIVAIGTIADVVPLRGENRILVAHGLAGLRHPVNIGLRALLQATGLAGREVCFDDVSFRIAPRINALGRLGDSREAVELFDSTDGVVAERLAARMNEQNQARQAHEARMLGDIEQRYGTTLRSASESIIIVSGADWHAGVAGIVASRLVDSYYRPTLVVCLEELSARGSGRSVAGFHLLEALESCGAHFEKFGGHAQAVGFTLPLAHLDCVIERLRTYARSHLPGELLCREYPVDAMMRPEQIGPQILDEIARLAPFGHGNPVPCFASREVSAVGEPQILKERHLKFRIGSRGKTFEAIWWKQASLRERLDFSRTFDLLYTFGESEYRGLRSIQLQVLDMRQEIVASRQSSVAGS